MDQPHTPTPGPQRFGRYEVVDQLGRGAMGTVFKARDPQINRLVAVKTVSLSGLEPVEEREFRQRFTHEAQAAGRLYHPGIVAIFDVGENPENHDPYIVMEYVSGQPLNRTLAGQKKLPLGTALELAEEIAEALDYAHAQGVVHRDIKPGNILVTPEGHAKIADFGIAKLNLTHFTLPGRVLGTPAYMAPEQLSGTGVDGRSDLFSLGVILYVMVTGSSPFQGDNINTVCFAAANREPVAATAIDASLPQELDQVISRAMAKLPDERYQQGAEFAADVRQLRQMLWPNSTTVSLRVSGAGGTRTNAIPNVASGTTAFRPTPASGRIDAQSIRSRIMKIPRKDWILGGATVAALAFATLQSQLLVKPTRVSRNAPAVMTANPEPGVKRTAGNPESVASSALLPAPLPTPLATPLPATAAPGKNRTTSAAPKPQIVVPLSTIELAVQHQFKDATLFVWVDDKLTLTRPLHAAAQKRLIVFNGLKGSETETMKIPAGKHEIRVRTLSADQTIDLSRTVSGDFVGGGDKSLQVSVEKHNTVLRLTWQ